MAQHFLDGANVSTTYEQVCGKRMPQRVGCCLDWQAGSFSILGNNILDGPCRQSHFFTAVPGVYLTTIANKQRLKIVPSRPQVTLNPLRGGI
jgi:hypothetical protein